jgi:hypothetical protein
MPIAQQNAVIDKVAHEQTLHPRDRLTAILIIVFAQRAEDAALTWDQITITADTVTIDLAGLPFISRHLSMNPFARWSQATTTAKPQHIATRPGYFAATHPADTSDRRTSPTTYGLFSPRSKRD